MAIEDRIILIRKPYSLNIVDDYLEYVLCHLPDNQLTPYVVWAYNKNDKAYYLGHYFEDLKSALIDFLNRGPNKLEVNLNENQ